MTRPNGWFRLNRHDEPTTPPPPPAPGAPTGQPTSTPPGPDPATPVDVSALPPNVQKLIADLRNENGKHRTDKQTAAQAATAAEERLAAVLKAAGLNPDGTTADDPAAAAAQLAKRAEHAEALAFQNGVKFNVHQAAVELGGDAGRLLDSMSFIDSLDDLVEAGTDPGSPEFAAAVKAKVAAAIESNPAYKVATGPTGPRPDPGQGTRPPVVSDFTKADHKDFAAELKKYGLRPRTYS